MPLALVTGRLSHAISIGNIQYILQKHIVHVIQRGEGQKGIQCYLIARTHYCFYHRRREGTETQGRTSEEIIGGAMLTCTEGHCCKEGLSCLCIDPSHPRDFHKEKIGKLSQVKNTGSQYMYIITNSHFTEIHDRGKVTSLWRVTDRETFQDLSVTYSVTVHGSCPKGLSNQNFKKRFYYVKAVTAIDWH